MDLRGGCQWCVYVGHILGFDSRWKGAWTFQTGCAGWRACGDSSVAEEGPVTISSHFRDLLLLAAAPSLYVALSNFRLKLQRKRFTERPGGKELVIKQAPGVPAGLWNRVALLVEG